MKTLNCLGDICPIPLLILKKELGSIAEGETVLLITDHSCSCHSVKEFCDLHQFRCMVEEVINGVWELTIVK